MENEGILTTCRVCGTEYEYCYTCEKVNSWRALTDTADHYYLLCVLMDYRCGKGAKECYQALVRHGFDFSDLSLYLPHVQEMLVQIQAESEDTETDEETELEA